MLTWPYLNQRTARQEQDLGEAVGSWAPRHPGSPRVAAQGGTVLPPASIALYTECCHIFSIPLHLPAPAPQRNMPVPWHSRRELG